MVRLRYSVYMSWQLTPVFGCATVAYNFQRDSLRRRLSTCESGRGRDAGFCRASWVLCRESSYRSVVSRMVRRTYGSVHRTPEYRSGAKPARCSALGACDCPNEGVLASNGALCVKTEIPGRSPGRYSRRAVGSPRDRLGAVNVPISREAFDRLCSKVAARSRRDLTSLTAGVPIPHTEWACVLSRSWLLRVSSAISSFSGLRLKNSNSTKPISL